MTRLILSLTLICGVCGFVSAQSPSVAATDKVDRLFEKWNKPDSPGCALGVIRDGQFVYKRGYGMADLGRRVPIDTKTVFYIASMSKQFTAMSVALLAEQGKLSLDDDIRKYLPEMPRYARPVTIRNLVYHTSGIRDFIVLRYLAAIPVSNISRDDENYERIPRLTTEDNYKLIARQRSLNFLPGDEHMYSNSNYTLLGEIVRRVSGQSLSEFADTNIFVPLGMTNTHYYDDLFLPIKNRAVGYAPAGGGFVPAGLKNGTVGPAGVLTTVDDLLKWDRNFYDNKLGKGGPALIDTILTPGGLNNGDKLQYAFGLIHYKYRGLDAVGHDGGFFGFKTSMNRFPQQRSTVICLCNAKNIPMDELADQVADIYLSDKFLPAAASKPVADPKPIELTPAQLEKFVGIYRNPTTEGLWMLSVKDGKLFDPGNGGSVVVPVAENRFKVVGQPVEMSFEMSTDGTRAARLLVYSRSRPPQIYSYEKGFSPSVRELEEYAGSFSSDEIGATYTFFVRDGHLWLQRPNGLDIPLQPTFKDHFWNDEFGYFGFSREAGKPPSALSYSGGWVRHLQFKRTRK